MTERADIVFKKLADLVGEKLSNDLKKAYQTYVNKQQAEAAKQSQSQARLAEVVKIAKQYVEDIHASTGLPGAAPEVIVGHCNAYHPAKHVITIDKTSTLLMTNDEIRGVMAHELGHSQPHQREYFAKNSKRQLTETMLYISSAIGGIAASAATQSPSLAAAGLAVAGAGIYYSHLLTDGRLSRHSEMECDADRFAIEVVGIAPDILLSAYKKDIEVGMSSKLALTKLGEQHFTAQAEKDKEYLKKAVENSISREQMLAIAEIELQPMEVVASAQVLDDGRRRSR